MACTCARIQVGGELTDHRNWNPECGDHGVTSQWWHSPEQIEKRAVQNQRLRALQAEAARRRKETP